MNNESAPVAVKADIRTQRWYGAGLFLLGLAFLVVFATIGRGRLQGWFALPPVVTGMCLLAIARNEFRRARARWHGIHREASAIAEAEIMLKRRGFGVTSNVQMRGRGDIDMVISQSRSILPVEIKSYREWDPTSERGIKALLQVERAQGYLHAKYGFLWLPDAKVSWWRRWFGSRYGRIYVAFGSARNLARIAYRHID